MIVSEIIKHGALGKFNDNKTPVIVSKSRKLIWWSTDRRLKSDGLYLKYIFIGMNYLI